MAGRFYSTAGWTKISKAQLARAPVCQGCEQAAATCVDHIQPIKRDGAKRERANLQSLCRSCHAAKTRAETDGKQWIPPKYKGCDSEGVPLHPDHPWRELRDDALCHDD